MKFRLRVLVAVAATAVLGVAGAVTAALPASAVNTVICENSNPGLCIAPVETAGTQFEINSGQAVVFIQNCSGPNGQITYQGNPYCEIHQSSPVYCMEWDSNTNHVVTASCDGNIKSQHWYWTGYRFRNYYAATIGHSPCLNETSGLINLAACSGQSTAWTY